MKTSLTLSALLLLGLVSCSEKTEETIIEDLPLVESFGKMPDGAKVSLFTLKNKNGMIARVTEYGAILTSLEVPDKDGKVADITHGYDDLPGWLTNTSFFGATAGRYGNRIAKGKFSLNGEDYTLAVNNEPNHLHGGIKGFDKVLWSGKPLSKNGAQGVELTYVSKDGEEGYPGELTTVVTYWLTNDNELIWEAKATVTGKSTPINIVHHSYWNLSNDRDSSINDHHLTLHADKFLPTDAGMIPTGELASVAGTPFDFTKATAIGERIEDSHEALALGGGYDHCWVLNDAKGVRLAATLHDPKTGRTMDLSTDQPGIQFYAGNFLSGKTAGKGGAKYPKRSACCLETQVFPDSPNKKDFPNSILKPGETYSHTMIHKFSW